MIRFTNRLTGTLMLVSPEREAEYRAAGHHPAPEASAPEEARPAAVPKTAKRPRKAAKQKEG